MKKIFLLPVVAITLFSCQQSCDEPNITPGVKPEIIIPKTPKTNKGLALETKGFDFSKGDVKAVISEAKSTDNNVVPESSYMISVVNSDILFYASEPGEYKVEVSQGDKSITKTISVSPNKSEITKYINKVYEYMPAPGQFVNELPEYEEGDTQETMNQKAFETIGGENLDKNMLTLGAWGGYVVFGFDHSIQNVDGKADFKIEGNAFVANSIGDNLGSKDIVEGSVEPGIIYVSYDKNNNGLPDDEWFEILGSGSLTIENEPWVNFIRTKYPNVDLNIYRDYEMTYHRPKLEASISDLPDPNKYIEWDDNKNHHSYMLKNEYHDQPYYPQWIKADEMVFKGVRLASNMYQQNHGEGFFLQLAYNYGYVDNMPNNDIRSNIDIGWAADKNGKKVKLPYIDFIKVQNGVYGLSPTLGEQSTEIIRAMDLHVAPVVDINTADIVKKQ